jgi:hypothetical protein
MWPFKNRFLNPSKLRRVAKAIYEVDNDPEWNWEKLEECYNLGHPWAEKKLSRCVEQAKAALTIN